MKALVKNISKVSITCLVLILLSACGSSDSTPPDAVQLVEASYTIDLDKSSLQYQQGPLHGGTAVLVNNLAAYWVKGGVTNAANGFAMQWSTNARIAPTGIDFDSIKAAVDSSNESVGSTPTAIAQSTKSPSSSASSSSGVVDETVGGLKVRVLTYIPEQKRRQIFDDTVAVQDRGISGTESYRIVAQQYGLTVDEVRIIAFEGAAKGWLN